ncbi:MAG TPA: DUF222 domain-containing protein [Acidimicrobiia bacterium]|nr:DUF222 domain-containing protein [Acidimicrobiia bacterium]
MLGEVGKVRSLLEALARDFDASILHGRDSLELVRELGAIQCLLDGLKARAAKRVEETCAYMAVHDADAKYTVARAFRIEPSEAQRTINLAERLESLTVVDAAVRAGEVSGREAQLIVEAAQHNPDAVPQLLTSAGSGLASLKDACVAARAVVEDPDARSKRQHRQRSFRMWTDSDGMMVGRFALTPEVGGQIKAIVDKGVQQIFRKRRAGEEHEPHEAYAADVLANAFLHPTEVPAAKVTTHLVMDHSILALGDQLPGAKCEIPGVGPVNAQWARDLLGESFLTFVIKKGKDITTVAHVGRHIPAELRTALVVSGRECDVEGCHNRGYLEIDHSHPFAKGGVTSWQNLRWLCYLHHKRKTQGHELPRKRSQSRARRPALVSAGSRDP